MFTRVPYEKALGVKFLFIWTPKGSGLFFWKVLGPTKRKVSFWWC